jgi:hypothetical protein
LDGGGLDGAGLGGGGGEDGVGGGVVHSLHPLQQASFSRQIFDHGISAV